MNKFVYILLSKNGKSIEEYTCYSDIALEYGVTRNSVAGKYNRAHKKNSNIIEINGNYIKQVKLGL